MTHPETVTLLDGGTGQELIARRGRAATRAWSTEALAARPDLVEAVHADYLAAGADVITLASFAATPTRLAGSGRGDAFEGLQRAAIQAAMDARARVRPDARIAGCLPPLPGSYRPGDRAAADATLDEYRRIGGVQAGGVDLMLCETLGSAEEARLATLAAVEETGLPVWTALTVDESDGRALRSGAPVAEGAAAAREAGASVVLANCAPPEAIGDALAVLLEAGGACGAYANGFKTVEPMARGETVDALEAREDVTPDAYAGFAQGWVEAGAAVVGGCCEIAPAHIAAVAERLGRSVRT